MTIFTQPQRPIKHILTVKVSKGLVIRDSPRPESQGGNARRTVPVGKTLYAYNIFDVGPVPYAELVPEDPTKPEFVRVREADFSILYVDVFTLPQDEVSDMTAIHLVLVEIRDVLEAMRRDRMPKG